MLQKIFRNTCTTLAMTLGRISDDNAIVRYGTSNNRCGGTYGDTIVLWECRGKKLSPLHEAKVLLTMIFMIRRPHLNYLRV